MSFAFFTTLTFTLIMQKQKWLKQLLPQDQWRQELQITSPTVSPAEKQVEGLFSTQFHVLCWGGKCFPTPFQVLRADLRIKLTIRQINRRKSRLILHTQGIYMQTSIPRTGKVTYICHSGLRRREQESGTSTKRKVIHRKNEKKHLANKCLLSHTAMDYREEF